MNYFPHLSHFKNSNQPLMPFFFPYPFHNPFFFPNHLALPQFNYGPQLWRINNELIQNLKHQISEQNSKIMAKTQTPSERDQSGPITQQEKNSTDKSKAQKKAFKQKEGRNMISNLFRQALKCMLQQKEKTIILIEKVCQKYQIDVNPREFLEGLSKKLKNLKNYVRIGQIEIFLKGKENSKSRQFAKLLRILVNRFLRQEVIPCLSNNPKIQNSNRMIHILERRKFQQLISLC